MNSLKRFKVLLLPSFEKQAALIIKKYPSFKNDIATLVSRLQLNPEDNANHLGAGVYKIRVEITGKPAGKSYGARVIYAVFTITSEILLIAIYDKSLKKDLTPEEVKSIKKLVKEIRATKKPN